MPRPAEDMSLAELERVVNNKKSLLERSLKRREQLKKELDDAERQIRVLERRPGYSTAMLRRRPSGPRVKNEKSLHTVVTEVLTKNKKGLSLADLHDRVLETGYKTASKNFKNVLYQCLYNSKHFTHDASTGRYKLTKA